MTPEVTTQKDCMGLQGFRVLEGMLPIGTDESDKMIRQWGHLFEQTVYFLYWDGYCCI